MLEAETPYDKLDEPQQKEIKLYPYRYFSLFVYCLMALVNAFAPQTFVAVSIEISELYDQSSTVLNLSSLSYTLAHSFIVFPANYVLDHLGLKTGITLGNGFMILGFMIRVLISYEFWLYILGTYITSIGFIFILNGATKFTNTWFGVKQTTIVNSIILFLLFASEAIGIFIPAVLIDKNSTKANVFHVVLYISIAIISIHMLGLIFIRDKPPTPANYSSQKTKEKFWPSIKELVRNKNYIMLFLSVMCAWGCVSAFFVTLPWMFKPYGFTSSDVGIIVLCANGLGLFSSIIVGLYVQKTKKYRTTLNLLMWTGVLFVGVFWLVLQVSKYPIVLYITSCFIGMCFIPFFTLIIDLSNEVAFPIGEATSSGFLLCGGQLFGFVLGLLMSLIFDGQTFWKTRIGQGIYISLFVLSGVFVFLYKQDLKKLKYQKQRQVQNESIIIEQTK